MWAGATDAGTGTGVSSLPLVNAYLSCQVVCAQYVALVRRVSARPFRSAKGYVADTFCGAVVLLQM